MGKGHGVGKSSRRVAGSEKRPRSSDLVGHRKEFGYVPSVTEDH